jgi:uncharacterized damage-inducible protein DinB
VEELAELHRFNAWANRSLLAGVRQLRAEQLTEQRDGMYDTVLGLLGHLAKVEFVYLRMIRSEAVDWPDRDLTLDEVERILEDTGAGLVAAAGSCSPEARVRIPWFERDFAVSQCLRQVLTHSINHRADVNGWLPHLGVESTGLDYINLALTEG